MIGQHYYTWCAAGAGIAGYPGFQTRAQSPSVTEQVCRQVFRYCERYELPRSLERLKAKVEDLTAEELATCPVGLHLYRVTSELWGLTRMRMARRQKGRPGNYFAHTFLFPWEALRPFGYNPFAVVQAGLFRDDAEGTSQELRDLEAFSTDSSLSEPIAALHQSLAKRDDVLTDILASLTTEPPQVRPVILCASTWSECEALIQGAMLLLPPSARACVTFSTYEADPYRLLPGSEDKANSRRTVIATIPPEDGGKFQFRQDEVKSRFYVLDLSQGRSSDFPAPSPYVRYVCDALIQRGEMEPVRRLHCLIECLDVAHDPRSWSDLIPVVTLVPPSDEGERKKPLGLREVRAAIEALEATCKTAAQASQGLRILWNRCRQMVSEATPDTAGAVLGAVAGLLQRCGDPDAFRRELVPDLPGRLAGFLGVGSYILASELLNLAGPMRDEIRRGVVRDGWREVLRKNWGSGRTAQAGLGDEKVAFVRLLGEALEELIGDSAPGTFCQLLTSGFRVAESAGCLGPLWKAQGAWVLTKALRRLPAAEAGPLAGHLSAALAEANELDGHWEVLLWRVEHPYASEDRDELFGQIATACGRREEPAKAAVAFLERASRMLPPAELVPVYVALGDCGHEGIRDEALRQYLTMAENTRDERSRWDLSRRVASLGGAWLLARQCVAASFRQSAKPVTDVSRAWTEQVFRHHAATGLVVAQELAAAAAREKDPTHAGAVLAQWLQAVLAVGPPLRQAAGVLAESFVLTLPLRKLSESGITLDTVDTGAWGPAAQACVEMAQCIADAERVRGTRYLDLVSLFREKPGFVSLLDQLDEPQWSEACRWVVRGLRGNALEDQQTAVAAVKLLLDKEGSVSSGPQQWLDAACWDEEKGLRAADVIAEQLRGELIYGPLRKDVASHVVTLGRFVCVAAEVAAQGCRDRSGRGRGFNLELPQEQPVERRVARLVGSVLAEESRLPQRLLWAYCETHTMLEPLIWKKWLRRFRRHVRRASAAREWETSLFVKAFRSVWRLFKRPA